MSEFNNVLTIEGNELPFTVVEPGSANDPFTAHPTVASVAVGNPQTPGEVVAAVGDGPQVQTPIVAQPPLVQTPVVITNPVVANTPVAPVQVPAPVVPVVPVEPVTLSPAEQALKDGKLAEYIASQVAEANSKALRAQQSAYDKTIQKFKDEADEAKKAALRVERDGFLKSDDLSDNEKDLLKKKWELDDRAAEIGEYEKKVDDYWMKVYRANLVSEKAQFGVTVEELEQFTEQSDMEKFALEKELAFYRDGKTTQIPSTAVTPQMTPPAVVATPEQPAPAGASAPSDIGGGSVVAPQVKWEDGSGVDVMARNINRLPWTTVSLP